MREQRIVKGGVVTTMRGRLSWAFLSLGALTCVAYLLLRTASTEPVAYLVAASVGVVMSVLGACLVQGPRRRVWVAMAAGQVVYFAGDVLWVIYESVLNIAPYPSLADVLFLARYPLLSVGLLWLIRGRRQGRDRAAFLDTAIISTGFAVLGGVFVIAPAAADGGETLLSQLVAGAYPVGDLLLLAALVRLFTSGVTRNVSFWSLGAGLAIMMVFDTQYLLSVLSGVWFPISVNVGWLVGYVLIGFSALHSSVDRLSEPTPDWPERVTSARFFALGLALALAPLTELLARLTGREANPYIVVSGALVGTVLVLVRMAGLLRALQSQAVQLAALARNDGLTGARTAAPGTMSCLARARPRGRTTRRSPSHCWTWTTSRPSTMPGDMSWVTWRSGRPPRPGITCSKDAGFLPVTVARSSRFCCPTRRPSKPSRSLTSCARP